jgi:hypothetical protein
MLPRPARSRLRRLLPLVLLVPAQLLAACGGADAPLVSFDPASPCTADGQQPGAYPELEALLPAAVEGVAPQSVDSGRTCTAEALGSLAGAGIKEVRYAGATWPTGGTSGWTIAAFSAAGLDAAKMHDFYLTGARGARRTEKVDVSDTTVGDIPAKRLDVLQSDGTGQTVVTWQKPGDDIVWAFLAADVGDTRVAELLKDFGAR